MMRRNSDVDGCGGVGKRRLARQFTALALALSLGACSAITEPYVQMRAPAAPSGAPQAELPVNPDFAVAKQIARFAAEDFHEKLGELEKFDLVTGTLLVGAGLAGLAMGLYGAHEDALFGAAVAGGTAVAGRAFLPTQARKNIYRLGTGALECAIASIGLGAPDDAPAVARGARAGAAPTSRGALGIAAHELHNLANVNAMGTRGALSVGLRTRADNLTKAAMIATHAGVAVSAVLVASRTRALATSAAKTKGTARALAAEYLF